MMLMIKNNIACKFCKKKFNHRSNKCNHEKICKFKNNINNIDNINNTNKKIERLENTISELKELILQHVKIHPKTLQKINTNIDTNIDILSQNNEIISNNFNNTIIEINNSNNEFINFTQNIITFNGKLIKFFFYNEQVYMKANNIAKILDYEDLDIAIRNNVDIRDKFKISDFKFIDSKHINLIDLLKNEDLQTIFINESGFYSLIFGSKKDIATQFKYWITSEILPKNYSFAIVFREHIALI